MYMLLFVCDHDILLHLNMNTKRALYVMQVVSGLNASVAMARCTSFILASAHDACDDVHSNGLALSHGLKPCYTERVLST